MSYWSTENKSFKTGLILKCLLKKKRMSILVGIILHVTDRYDYLLFKRLINSGDSVCLGGSCYRLPV